MTSPEYLLGRKLFFSSSRLNFQHFLWKEALGYLVHPKIEIRPDARIADVGTGTGIWLCDVARQVPSTVSLYGFDVSSDQFMSQEHLPRNTELSVLDCIRGFDERNANHFDIVHVRLLQAAIQADDPGPLIANCFKMLRPKGHILWLEHYPSAIEPRRKEGNTTPSLDALAEALQNFVPSGWIKRLPHLLEAEGFVCSWVEIEADRDWQRQMMMDMWCLIANEFADIYLDKHGPAGAGDNMRKIVEGAMEEIKQGSSYSQVFQIVGAQKP